MLKINVSEKDVINALEAELEVASRKLKIPGEEPPYFVSYLLRQKDHFEVWARFGALYGQKKNQGLICYAEVRVGDYELDQTFDGGLNNFNAEESNFWADNHPLDGNRDVLRYSLRLLTEDKYREALEGYYKKKSYLVGGGAYSRKIPNFYKDKPRVFSESIKKFNPNVNDWADLIVPLSEKFRSYPFLRSSFVEFSGDHIRTYYFNTEGSKIITDQIFFRLELHALVLDEKNHLIKRQKTYHFLTEDKVPSLDTLHQGIDSLALGLKKLQKAPLMEPHHGPVLLGPEASGLFFHEVLGHRLEGERLLSQGEGQTLKKKMGKKIIPEFISVYDDPTVKEYEGVPLMGHYLYDCEGIPSQRVDLIKNGKLQGFLLSRTPINKESRSNGHGRTEECFPPMARMANLFVEGQGGVSNEELVEILIKKVRELKKPFGLIIEEVSAGETDTSSYDFQVFKGEPERIYRVDAKTGKKSLVRGLEFIGTPLSAVNKIEAVGKEMGVFNSWCTAESGDVRVSCIAPSFLFSDMELQRSAQKIAPEPILQTYWEENFQNKKRN